MAKRHTIDGHTVESKKSLDSGQPYWVVKNERGDEVGCVYISATTNGANFCPSQAGKWSVQAVGPDYVREMNRDVDGEAYGMNTIRAQMAADKTHGTFNANGKCRRAADGVSSARSVVRDKAFPWLRQVLGKATQ